MAHDLEVDGEISLVFDAQVVNSKKMKPLAETREAKTKCICEKLQESDADWTRMKLPTSLGDMGIRTVTSQLETSFEITVQKTRAQPDRIEKSLAGKPRDTSCESRTEKKNEMWDGALSVEHEDRTETMTGPFKWDLVNASKGNGFSSSISRTLKTHEIITAHKIWSKLDVPEKGQLWSRCWCDMGRKLRPEQGMLDEEWRTAARRRLRLKTEESKICQRGTLKDEKGDRTLACQGSPWRTRIHNRVRDSLARQLRRIGATVDLEESRTSDTETRVAGKRSELRESMLLPRFQVRTSCNGWTSQSGGQQL